MSVKTTRRGLFALAAAVVGVSTLAAAKPAETPSPWPPPSHASMITSEVRGLLSSRGMGHYPRIIKVGEPSYGGIVPIELELETPHGRLGLLRHVSAESLDRGQGTHERIAADFVAHAAALIKRKELA